MSRWTTSRWALTLRNYVVVAAVIFTLVAAVQLIRIIIGWSVIIAGWQVPVWLSAVIAVIAAFLAWSGFQHARRL